MDTILDGWVKSGRHAFRTREYAALLGKPTYARLVLHRLKGRGELLQVRNGWWAFPNSIPEAVACEISAPAYLSFHSALYLHGLTTQIPNLIQVAVTRFGKKYSMMGRDVKEYKIEKSRFNGFSVRDGLPLASPEKAFADCLDVPRSCPEVVLREAIGEIDVKKAERWLSKAGLRRLGRFLND
jgi:predicted transcriptional regulator of viral defense system